MIRLKITVSQLYNERYAKIKSMSSKSKTIVMVTTLEEEVSTEYNSPDLNL